MEGQGRERKRMGGRGGKGQRGEGYDGKELENALGYKLNPGYATVVVSLSSIIKVMFEVP